CHIGCDLIYCCCEESASSEIYTLSLHDALPIYSGAAKTYTGKVIADFAVKALGPASTAGSLSGGNLQKYIMGREILQKPGVLVRSEEHTSELQSRENLVCRLLLEKKKKNEEQLQ